VLFKATADLMQERKDQGEPIDSIPAQDDIDGLVNLIDIFRTHQEAEKTGYFEEKDMANKDDVINKIEASSGVLNSDQKALISENVDAGRFTAVSNNFRIRVEGCSKKIKKEITAVYNRADKKFVYWRQ
jgi:hypothetical protein